jgi:DNA invertase Pin-like site-specific DNA recombinase
MLAGVAELERNLIAERTSAALRHKVARGERVGAPPYGYAATGEGTAWVEVPEEQRTIQLIRGLRTQGRGRSYSEVGDHLNKLGVVAKMGARWYAATVRGVITRRPVTNITVS